MCTPVIIVISIVFTLLVCLALLTIFYAFYIVCKNKEQIPNTSKTIRIIFMVATTFTIAYYPVIRWRSCFDPDDYIMLQSFVNPIWMLAYGTQIITLCILFFNKIVQIFVGTSLEFSKLTQNTYKIVFIFQIVNVCGVAITFFLSKMTNIYILYKLYSLLVSFGVFLMSIMVMISLTILFIHKLVYVYKKAMSVQKQSEKNNESHLVTSITKLTLLISISTSITFTHLMVFFLYSSKTDQQSNIQALISTAIGSYIGFIDCYSNFVITMLSSKVFGIYYDKMCTGIAAKCRMCWIRIIDSNCCKEQSNQTLEMVMNHSVTSETSIERKNKSQSDPGFTESKPDVK
eukprot:469769_1